MTPSRTPDKTFWLLLLALLSLVSETGAWWWMLQTPGVGFMPAPAWLGLGALLCAGVVVFLLWRQIGAARRGARHARRLLTASLNTLDVGLEIWDRQDRLIFYNKKINMMRVGLHTPADIGQTFETLLRAKLKQHLVPAAIGREDQWLVQRLATRGTHTTPQLKELAGNQWAKTCETRTADGYLVASWVDVTEPIRKGKILEASNQHLVRLSSIDELTGLANRRRFDEALVAEWQRSARSGTPLSLLMIDIDHFKEYNDNYGHVTGDECLQRVAEVLERCVRRAGEMAARYGGEEFVLLLPNADMAYACETAQKCLDQMAQEAVPHAASRICAQVTFSIGVASLLPDAQQDPSSMVNAADTAMYRAKSAGRARFETADQADWDIEKDTPRTHPAPLC